MTARTLYDKLWDDHVVCSEEDGTATLYIDRHLVHEVQTHTCVDTIAPRQKCFRSSFLKYRNGRHRIRVK